VAFTLQELATRLSAELRGDGALTISGGQSLDKAREGEIAFIADVARARNLQACRASAFLVGQKFCDSPHLIGLSQAILVVEDPKLAFLEVLEMFLPPRRKMHLGISSHATIHPTVRVGLYTNIHPGAQIAEDVVIGEHCDIHPGVCIGPGCRIGNHSVLYPHVVLYHDIQVGERVIINAGAVIGTNGFGYRLVEGRHQQLHHFGSVRIEDDVEIGANATIDRGLIGETTIGQGTKIDNQVQVAHNCEIGKHNLMAGHVAFAGSVTTDDYVICAGQVGIADHVHIGLGAVLAAQTGVSKSLPGGQTYFGSPAQEIGETRKQMAAVRRLPEMREQMRELAAEIHNLKAHLETLSQSRPGPDEDSTKPASAA
jgi:UDP-3-O-[3-hydroxymyristoyl] glucosamine N-acyltransferase